MLINRRYMEACDARRKSVKNRIEKPPNLW